MTAVNLTEISDHILFVLGGHIGRDKAMRREDVDAYLCSVLPSYRLQPWPTRDRQMRKAIARCCPWVCSGATGYYFPETEAEVQKAVGYIDKKIYGLYDRRRAILAKYPDVGGQMRLGV